MIFYNKKEHFHFDKGETILCVKMEHSREDR